MSNDNGSTQAPIEARCTRCRKNTTHTIIEMGPEEPVKVQCGSCNREHKYRPPTKGRKTAASMAVEARNAELAEWQRLRANMDAKTARRYSMETSLPLNCLIDHPLFGLGVVQRYAGPHKVEILFEDGCKLMRCG